MFEEPTERRAQKTSGLVAALLLGSLAMLALSFASAPLYRAFCAATGFGGAPKTQNVVASVKRGERNLLVRFDANVSRELPWRFEPEIAKVSQRTGETKTVFYKVENLSDSETSGQAAYNVTPGHAGPYFVKIMCFCFTEQRLAPHEKAEWPVVFYLDPALEQDESMKRVEEITLSYSFFPTKPLSKSKTSDALSSKPKS